jgi:peptide/nickel transport system substrate-binding protein
MSVRAARLGALFVVLGLAMAACGPAGPSSSSSGGSQTTAAPSHTIVFLTHVEPGVLTPHRALTGTGSVPSDAIRLFNASLFMHDERAIPQAYLVESRPQLNSDSWQVFPEGRMETTYRLRSGLTWHDGAPLTADDFVFGWRVALAPEYGVANLLPRAAADDVVAIDSRTILVRWNRPYPLADAMQGRDWSALPRHLLEAAFQQQAADQFITQPYWTKEFVGLGPFKLDRWEPGAFIEGSAFDGHALGRPKIDRLKVLFVGDPNTSVANLLSGEAQVAVDFTIGFEQALVLRREWPSRGGGSALLTADKLRYVQIEYKPDYTSPRDILDLRVRKALNHAIDRQGLVDALIAGEAPPADTMVPPSVEYYAAVDRAITKYAYDPRLTEQHFADAGFRRGGDGVYVNAVGQRFSPELRAVANGQEERENAIIADGWRRVGVDVRSRMLSEVEDSDRELRSTFPAFSQANTGLDEPTLLIKLYSGNVPSAVNRWTGSNRGGWSNPEYDRLYEMVTQSLDRSQRNQAMVEAMKLVNDELPVFPLYYNYIVTAHAAALSGPVEYAPGGSGMLNVAQWQWRG